MSSIHKNILIIGDATGKTAVLRVFCGKGFDEFRYDVTAYEEYEETIEVDGQVVKLTLWDTGSLMTDLSLP